MPDLPEKSPWPSIAIVTPSFNQSRFLPACMAPVLDQDYMALQYAIFDGGSTDGSVEIIKLKTGNLRLLAFRTLIRDPMRLSPKDLRRPEAGAWKGQSGAPNSSPLQTRKRWARESHRRSRGRTSISQHRRSIPVIR
jgi:glycosyltransferase involved in cell wall biosynthesis